MMLCAVRFLLAAALFVHQSQSQAVLSLVKGQVLGRREVTYSNATFYAYQQIPYAEPPVGELRFMAPQPSKGWEGVLDCTKDTKICRQMNKNNPMETEDCLYLNVYTHVAPGSSSDLLFPVMFFIYGGGFNHGSATFAEAGPHYFMEHRVVLVTVNYRTGPLGFLSTGDTTIPGNNGLKDQNLALKWVQENIHVFGGDPTRVTIFGQSAGAASVTYQILSKQSAGLFRAAIAMSGSAISPWTYQRHAKDIAYQFAAQFDESFATSKNRSSKQLLDLLQGVAEEDLAAVASSFKPEGINSEEIVQGYYYAPVIEVEHEGAFITENQYGLLDAGVINKVPLMMGICSEEELQRALNQTKFKEGMAKYEADVSNLVNEDLHLETESDKVAAGEQVRRIYTDGELAANLSSAVRFYTDTAFVRSIRRYAELQSKYTDVYFYQFSYFGKMTRFEEIDLPGTGKVPHAGDNHYLWALNNESNLSVYPEADVMVHERFVKLFTDFSKFLNPTPDKSVLLQNITWPKVTKDDFWYLDIDKDLEVKVNPRGEAYDKWVQVYDTWGVQPYDTY